MKKTNKQEWHNIRCISPNGEIKWVASYDGKFSAYYAMQLWWCSKHKCDFFCKQNLKKASEHIKISKSMRSVMFDYDDVTYILSTPKGRTIMEGLGECAKYEYNRKQLQ